jgi:hypothetical protein
LLVVLVLTVWLMVALVLSVGVLILLPQLVLLN